MWDLCIIIVFSVLFGRYIVTRRNRARVQISERASFEEVASAYSAFLQEDPRVPPEARRLARGLAPYARRTAKHFGTLPELCPDSPLEPFDAKAALRRAKELPGERGVEARAAVNYSVFLWNQLIPDGL